MVTGGAGAGVVTEMISVREILGIFLPGMEFLSCTEDTVGAKDNPKDLEFCPLLTGSVLS